MILYYFFIFKIIKKNTYTYIEKSQLQNGLICNLFLHPLRNQQQITIRIILDGIMDMELDSVQDDIIVIPKV